MTPCSCGNHGSLITLAKQVDPTRTKTLRDRFVADMTRRFRAITRLITESVVTNDAFGLNPQDQPFPLEAAGPGQFDFPQDKDKLTAFMAWLQQQERENIFEIVPSTRIGAAAAGSWMNFYIDSAYKQGVRRARQEMRKEGVALPVLGNQFQDEISVAFNAPVHSDRVALLYARDFSELQGITAAMDQQISRVLSEGLINGWGTERMAQELNDRVEKIGITRARMLARTEVIRAHHLATIQEYRNAELQDIKIQAEFSTAGDGRVCVICRGLNGKIFSLKEAEGLIPVHPNCVTGDSVIIAPDITRAMRVKYTGDLYEILTAEGVRLAVTPNHMLLTPAGLVMARFLAKGAELINSSTREGVFVSNPDDKDNPARIDNIFNSFSESSCCESGAVPISPVNFHGDGVRCQSNVDIIRTDSLLRNEFESIVFKDRHDFKLQWRGVCDNLSSGGTLAKFFERSFSPPNGFVGFSREILAFLRGCLLHPERHGVTSPPGADSRFRKDADDRSSGYIKLLSDCIDGHPVSEKTTNDIVRNIDFIWGRMLDNRESFLDKPSLNGVTLSKPIHPGNFGEASPFKVKSVGIADIKIFHVSSVDVYDVSTVSTGYIVNGVLSSNCRCVALPVIADE